MIPWLTSGDLVLDADGHLWSRYRDGWTWHGPIDQVTEIAEEHGADFQRLVAMWLDRFNPEVEQLRR